jgi:hypothetical protein
MVVISQQPTGQASRCSTSLARLPGAFGTTEAKPHLVGMDVGNPWHPVIAHGDKPVTPVQNPDAKPASNV